MDSRPSAGRKLVQGILALENRSAMRDEVDTSETTGPQLGVCDNWRQAVETVSRTLLFAL